MHDLLSKPVALLILSLFVSTVLAYISMPAIIKIANLKHLFDEPDFRKQHLQKTPTLGGMAIFIGLYLSYLFFLDLNHLGAIPFMSPALIIIFFMGIKDDIIVLTPLKKLTAQFVVSILIVVLGNIRINSFYGLFGIQEISYSVSIIVTILSIVAIINSYNLIDGIDGLAGMLGLLSAVSFGLWFYFTNNLAMMILAFSLAGSLIGFLFYNWSPAKIFMGDTGAMLIGFIISILAIQFIELNKARSVSAEFWIYASPSVAIAVISVPLLDMIRVFTVRIFQKKSPFFPDKNHIHNILLDLGLSHKQITLSLFVWNLFMILMALIFKSEKSLILLIMILSLFFIPVIVLNLKNKKKGIKSV